MTEVARVIRELDTVLSGVVAILSVRITANLIESTPVDTGFAKTNWVPRVGTPFTGTAGSRGATSSGSQSAGLAAVKNYRFGAGMVFIANNVAYIGDLNNGTSKQAPAGFVQGGIIRGIAEAKALAPALIARFGR